MRILFSKILSQNYWDFLKVMTQKEIKVRYKRASFGFLWLFLNPILQMVVIGTVFSVLTDIPNYFAYLLIGLLPWQFFSISVSKTTGCFVYESALLQKSKFPHEIIPLSIIFSNFFHFLISLAIYLIYVVFTLPIQLSNVFYLCVGTVWLLLFTIGTCLLSASLNVRYRDIAFFIQTALTLIFYLTPILYTTANLPTNIQNIVNLNPLTTIFTLFQSILASTKMPTVSSVLMSGISTATLLCLGIWVFKRQHKYFVDWI